MNLSISSESLDQVPLYIPAKFSVVLGGGPEKSSPLPFCADSSCFELSAQYDVEVGKKTFKLSSPLLQNRFHDIGSIPLLDPVASSSAFAGPLVMDPAQYN